MGRKASIKPSRSIYSLGELTELYKKENNTRMQKRLLAVKMMLEEEDISSYDVATRLSTSATSVRDWVNKYNQGGYEALKEKGPRGGKPRISDREFLNIMEEISIETPQWTLQKIAFLTQQKHKEGLKKSAVWYRLKKMGIHGRVADHTILEQTNRSKKHSKKRE